jgi:predicted hydrocarbon binding protein
MSLKGKGSRRGSKQSITESDEGLMIKLAMQSLGDHYGITQGRGRRAARVMGHQLGTDLATRFSSSDFDSLFEELSRFWRQNGIGEMYWFERDKMELVVKYSSEAIEEPLRRSYMLCPFKEGLIEAIVKKRLGRSTSVKEIECVEKQDQRCVFKIILDS